MSCRRQSFSGDANNKLQRELLIGKCIVRARNECNGAELRVGDLVEVAGEGKTGASRSG